MSDGITIELEPPVLEALARQAEAHGKTPTEEAADILKRNVRLPGDRTSLLAEMARIRALTPVPAQRTDSVRLIREDRDR